MVQFKNGDKVRLKKEFWKEPVWTKGCCARSYRKNVSKLTGEYTVNESISGVFGRNLTLAEDTGLLHVPADCFELVEKVESK